jgi:Tol biopolymer transport system component
MPLDGEGHMTFDSTRRWVVVTMLAIVAATSLSVGAQQSSQGPEARFERARLMEENSKTLNEAIALYKQVAAQAGANRTLAATALVRLAACYEKQGDLQARPIYAQVVRDFPDQAVAAEARAKLGAVRGAAGSAAANRVVWTPPNTVDIHGKISRDGRYVPFRDLERKDGGLFIRDVTTGLDRRLVGIPPSATVEESQYPEGSAFSRDGSQLAFAWRVRARGVYQLRVVPTRGEGVPAPRVLFDSADVEWLAPYDWTPDGRWIAAVLRRKDGTSSIGLVSARDGSWQQLRSVEWDGVSNMALSPAGDYLAFDRRSGDARTRDLFVLDVSGSHETPIVTFSTDEILVGWSPDGSRLLFVSDRSGTPGLWAIPVAHGIPSGNATLMHPNVGPFWPLGISSSGAIWSAVVTPGGAEVRSGAFDLTNRPSPVFNVLDDFAGPSSRLRWSHDGTHLSWASQWLGVRPLTPVSGDLQALRLSVRPTAGGETRHLRADLRYVTDFDWAPDDQALLVAGADRNGRTGIFSVDVRTGQSSPVVLTPDERVDLLPRGAVTGDRLYYRRIRIPSQTSKLVEYDLKSRTERDVLPWAARFFRNRPAAGSPVSVDALAVTADRQVLYLTNNIAAKVLMLRSRSLETDVDQELMRVAETDRLSFIEWIPEEQAALVRKDSQNAGPSELWRVSTDRSGGAVRVSVVDDFSGFTSLGWSRDSSLLLLGRRAQAGGRMETAALTPSGALTRLKVTLDAAPQSVTVSRDRRQVAYLTEFQAPTKPLAVWVLENVLPASVE